MTRKGWTRVAFGDVVRQVKDKVDPKVSNMERYVAGEHMNTDDLRIRRWGLIGDDYLGPAFHMRFKPGQVLYGSRRTYLRKVAIADFEGICANTTFVLEPKDQGVILPDLLPFVMQTEAFHAHSIEQSKGSVNPYVNFSDLAWWEFALPPLDVQHSMISTLRAAEHAFQTSSDALECARLVLKSATDALTSGQPRQSTREASPGLLPTGWRRVPLSRLLVLSQYGISTAPEAIGTYPILRMTNIENGEVIEVDLKFVDLPEHEFQNYCLEFGDVLFNRTNSIELVGRTGLYALAGEHVFASYLIRVRTDETVLLPAYLVAYLNSSSGRRQVLSYATKGVSQANVNASSLGKIIIPLPPVAAQQKILDKLAPIRRNIGQIEIRLEQVKSLRSRLVQRLVARAKA